MLRSALCVGAILTCAVPLHGCSRPSNPPAGETPAADVADAVYTTRGRIERLPGPRPGQTLAIHHQRIPDFKNKFGEVRGMDEMIMDFPDLAPGLSMQSLATGDAVEFTFEVRWGRDPRSLVTAIRKLPADTDLGLSAVSDGPK